MWACNFCKNTSTIQECQCTWYSDFCNWYDDWANSIEFETLNYIRYIFESQSKIQYDNNDSYYDQFEEPAECKYYDDEDYKDECDLVGEELQEIYENRAFAYEDIDSDYVIESDEEDEEEEGVEGA